MSKSIAAYSSFNSVWFIVLVLICGSFILFSFFFLLSSPSKGIQAPKPAVSQPAAAVGHHWVSSYTHIRQTVCRDGLRHLGWRGEPGSSLLTSHRSHTSLLHLLVVIPSCPHAVLFFTLDLACLNSHRLPFYSCSIKLFLFLTLHLDEEWNQWRNQILAQLGLFTMFILSCIYFVYA